MFFFKFKGLEALLLLSDFSLQPHLVPGPEAGGTPAPDSGAQRTHIILGGFRCSAYNQWLNMVCERKVFIKWACKYGNNLQKQDWGKRNSTKKPAETGEPSFLTWTCKQWFETASLCLQSYTFVSVYIIKTIVVIALQGKKTFGTNMCFTHTKI